MVDAFEHTDYLKQLACINQAIGILEDIEISASSVTPKPTRELTEVHARELSLSELRDEYQWRDFIKDRKCMMPEELLIDLHQREAYWSQICLTFMRKGGCYDWLDHSQVEKASAWNDGDWELNKARETIKDLKAKMASLKSKTVPSAPTEKRKSPDEEGEGTNSAKRVKTFQEENAALKQAASEQIATIKTLTSMLNTEEKRGADAAAEAEKKHQELQGLRAKEEKFRAMEDLFRK